ncbi:hypothetical protein IFM89_033282 [Coptis chinensis]|uniref:RNase H type-1 domain-containing protein n=1 Tax=Coptis chinensis TaxID=261450 RepID=A0A835HP58_9MAGN|nr:hypothetical protein IFM89_033282 [Coptis chinensis]
MQHHTKIANREDMLIKCQNESPLVQDLWRAAAITCLFVVWRNRNGVLYGSKKSSISSVMFQVRGVVKRAYDRSKKHMNNSTGDLEVLKAWKLPTKLKRAPRILECYWVAPPSTMIKVNADGCSRAVKSFQNDQVHWQIRAAWDKVKGLAEWIIVTNTWREVNFGADICSKEASHLAKGEKKWWDGRPAFVYRIEDMNTTYYRFVS